MTREVRGEAKIPELVDSVVYMVDHLPKAKIKAPAANYVGVHRIPIHRDNRTAIFQHPPSQIEFGSIHLGEEPILRFACGIKQTVWKEMRSGIIFEIFVRKSPTRTSRIFKRVLEPSTHAQDRQWVDGEIDLRRFRQQNIVLIFSTSIRPGASAEYCWSAWGEPNISHKLPKPPIRNRPIGMGHVFLITSDALRPDFLGCYGNSTISTPSCDQLAADGIRFSHARAQTASTLGSHASLLLSQNPLVHGVTTEWGSIRPHPNSLPGYMRAHGYRTVLIPSENELMDPRAGIAPLFESQEACLGNPAQDGALTTRIAMNAIDREQAPAFFWIEYFDTHPPVVPPEPYRSMYYSGDPTDAAQLYRPEQVARIRGLESMEEFYWGLPLLEKGRVDSFLYAKLQATVSALRGANASDCDLAIHLRNLGPRARHNMSLDAFTEWLSLQVHQLRQGRTPAELLTWLNGLVPMLGEIEAEIISWLDGVIDFRYPLSQYGSAISYFDSHIGRLCAYLKENGLYDQSTIILASPHGEILDEHDITFAHHTLMELCVRLPMIIKPPAGVPIVGVGRKVDGTFDSIDLFPTITELLGLPHPTGVAGISRWSHCLDGSPIPEHDSFAVNNSGTMSSITRVPYKFMKAARDHTNSLQWQWRAGDKALFDLREAPADTIDRLNDLPQIAREMEHRLDHFLKQHADNDSPKAGSGGSVNSAPRND